MGAHMVRRYTGQPEPDPVNLPASPQGPQFEERVMIATPEQMNMARLPLEKRDYCAHLLIKVMKCRRDMFPNIFACKQEEHDWHHCEHEDYIIRMKQYERERRLLVRKANQEKEEEEALAA